MATTTAYTLPEGAAPKIRALFDYWLAIHPAGTGDGARLPGRRHFDPIDIPELLPNIWMIDVERDAEDSTKKNKIKGFRFRLIGTEIVKFTGRDATGLALDEAYPDYRNTEAYRAHHAVADSGRPGYRKSGVLSNPERGFAEAERIYLPLAEDGRTVDIILVMTLYSGNPPRRRR